MELTAKLW